MNTTTAAVPGKRSGSRGKLAVYVPDSDLAKVSDALFEAGAGVIGQYSQCSFRVPGKGTFVSPRYAGASMNSQ